MYHEDSDGLVGRPFSFQQRCIDRIADERFHIARPTLRGTYLPGLASILGIPPSECPAKCALLTPDADDSAVRAQPTA
jgi:hypothetical protein